MHQNIAASPAQLRYANLLFYGAAVGFALMLITYAIYVLGILEPQVPMEDLIRLWSGSAADYRAAGNIPQGWGWLALLHKGDILNFTGIVTLAGLTIVCFLQLCVDFLRRKDHLMAILAALEILVLSLAASGLLVSAGH